MRRNTLDQRCHVGADSSAPAIFTPGYLLMLALIGGMLHLLNIHA